MSTTLDHCRACDRLADEGENDWMRGCHALLCKGCGDAEIPDRAAWRMVLAGLRPCPAGAIPADAEPVHVRPPASPSVDALERLIRQCAGNGDLTRGCSNLMDGRPRRCSARGGATLVELSRGVLREEECDRFEPRVTDVTRQFE